MNWPKVPLGIISKVISGYAFKSKEFLTSGNLSVIKIANIRRGYVDLSEPIFVDDKYLSIDTRFHVTKGDILISLTGSHITLPNSVVGRVAKYRYSHTSLLNQRAGKFLCNKNIVDSNFLYYALSLQETLERIASFAQGAANQANISPSNVESVNINLPPLPTQQRIASILSAYDDLIENNLRRIHLLEEAARCEYKLMMENSENWETVPIQDALEYYIGGGWGEEAYSGEFSNPAYVIRGTDIPENRKGNTTTVPFRFHKKSNLASRKLNSGDIVFEVSGGSKTSPVGRSLLINETLLYYFKADVMCASFCKLIRPNKKITSEYLYLFLIESFYNGALKPYEKPSASNIINFAFWKNRSKFPLSQLY